MLRLIGVALAALTIFVSSAEARPGVHRASRRIHDHVHSAPVSAGRTWASILLGNSLVAEARSQIGNGAIYGRANLWCARFVNYVLKTTGHSGTGSDVAASFARYGRRISGPQAGAIAVMHRRGGGHVGIVSGVDANGDPIVISGNNRNAVREAAYPKSRVYAYVLPND